MQDERRSEQKVTHKATTSRSSFACSNAAIKCSRNYKVIDLMDESTGSELKASARGNKKKIGAETPRRATEAYFAPLSLSTS